MSKRNLIRELGFPNLEVLAEDPVEHRAGHWVLHARAREVERPLCPHCGVKLAVRDWVRQTIRDAPMREHAVTLVVAKRRYRCRRCRKTQMQRVDGVLPRRRTTERFARVVAQACEDFVDLKSVRARMGCGYSYIYKTYYRMLGLRQRERIYPWPEVIGIDEHYFRHNPKTGRREFVTVVTDMVGKRLFELALGRTAADLDAVFKGIEGPERVRWVAMDLSATYRSYVEQRFPNATIVADKFHVLRLLSVPVNQAMRENWGRVHPKLKRQIMMGDGILNAAERRRFHRAFSGCGELSELVRAQCRLQRLYRMRSVKQAAHWFTRFTDELARSNVDALRTLRKTLMAWRTQVLAYFVSRLTNARTEGFNLKAKLVKRRGFGYRSPVNYRLRVLNACSGSTRASPYLTPGRLQFIDKEALIRRSKLLARRNTLDLSTVLNDPTQRE